MIRNEIDAGKPSDPRTASQVTGSAATPRTSSAVQASRRIAGIIARHEALVKGAPLTEGLWVAAPVNGGLRETLRWLARFRPAVPRGYGQAGGEERVTDRGWPGRWAGPSGAHRPVRACTDRARLCGLRRPGVDAEVGGGRGDHRREWPARSPGNDVRRGRLPIPPATHRGAGRGTAGPPPPGRGGPPPAPD